MKCIEPLDERSAKRGRRSGPPTLQLRRRTCYPLREEYKKQGATFHESPHGSTWSKLKTKQEVLHAETNAIAKMAQSGESCKDAVLFCTHEPCMDCAKLIFQSGIRHVIYKNSYDADKGSGLEFLEKSGCNVEKIRVDNES